MHINTTVGIVNIHFSDERFQKGIKEAQTWLDDAVLKDSTPYVPVSQGSLRGSGHVVPGGGAVEWNTPYAHYQYRGIVYGPNYPIKDKAGNTIGFYSPPKKYPTGRLLTYQEPGTGPDWFEKAKQKSLQTWIDGVKKRVGGG